MRLILTIAALVWATTCHGGAWLRAQGTGFLTSSVLQGADGHSDGALYFEYGVRPKLTLGIKVDANMVVGQLAGGSGFAFARLPIPTGDRAYKLAYEIGLGATLNSETEPLLRTGLSYGRGIKWREKYGWLAVDFAVEWSLAGAAHTAKLDTTLGLGITDTTKIMMQVFVSGTEDATSLTLAPSLIWQPREKKPSYQIGFEAEQGDVSLRLGLWQEF
ncbi:hypothetical protein [uncultured Tateyamaria sp.]|uniref:hypothetical protein n=1 Tax=Tateyamaria sp. 1078 TaxID=3417464 RepID=UPI0026109A5E|nr:hypothetical protein [uncultured Tateyamaria sp.]